MWGLALEEDFQLCWNWDYMDYEECHFSLLLKRLGNDLTEATISNSITSNSEFANLIYELFDGKLKIL